MKIELLELVRVKVFSALVAPSAPLTVIAPVVFNVKLDELAVVVLLTELKLIGVAAPVPTIKVLLSLSVVAPKVICPVDVPPMVVLSRTFTVPKLIIPIPAAEIVPSTLTCEGAVAVTPPINAVVLDAALLIVTEPKLLKVELPAILLFVPLSTTL